MRRCSHAEHSPLLPYLPQPLMAPVLGPSWPLCCAFAFACVPHQAHSEADSSGHHGGGESAANKAIRCSCSQKGTARKHSNGMWREPGQGQIVPLHCLHSGAGHPTFHFGLPIFHFACPSCRQDAASSRPHREAGHSLDELSTGHRAQVTVWLTGNSRTHLRRRLWRKAS